MPHGFGDITLPFGSELSHRAQQTHFDDANVLLDRFAPVQSSRHLSPEVQKVIMNRKRKEKCDMKRSLQSAQTRLVC